MTEGTRQQVEQAIQRTLYLSGRYRTPLGTPSYEYPTAIVGDTVVLRDGDCGMAKEPRVITAEEWERHARILFRRVGGWAFVPADDEAADAIAFCHRSPDAAGRELHRLRKERKAG